MFSCLCLYIMGSLAIHASLIDARTFRLPNRLTAGIFVVALLCLACWSRLVSSVDWYKALTWLVIAGVHCGFALLSRGALGMGDAKLIAGLSLPLVWWGAALSWLAIAYCSAAIFGMANMIIRKSRRIAFGPHLTGGWILLVMGQLAGVAMAYSR